MPIYDCGSGECEECQRAFGPDRSKAIANYNRREAAYAELERGPTARAREVVDGHIAAYGAIPNAETLKEEIAANLAFVQLSATPYTSR